MIKFRYTIVMYPDSNIAPLLSIVNTPVAWAIFAFTFVIGLLGIFVISYHWHKYSFSLRSLVLTEGIYTIGVIGLLLASFIFASAI